MREESGEKRPDGVQPVLERGDNAEVASSAAQRPEQVRVLLVVGLNDAAVGGDHFGGDEVVRGEAELAAEPADAAAGGQAADPGVRIRAAVVARP